MLEVWKRAKLKLGKKKWVWGNKAEIPHQCFKVVFFPLPVRWNKVKNTEGIKLIVIFLYSNKTKTQSFSCPYASFPSVIMIFYGLLFQRHQSQKNQLSLNFFSSLIETIYQSLLKSDASFNQPKNQQTNRFSFLVILAMNSRLFLFFNNRKCADRPLRQRDLMDSLVSDKSLVKLQRPNRRHDALNTKQQREKHADTHARTHTLARRH